MSHNGIGLGGNTSSPEYVEPYEYVGKNIIFLDVDGVLNCSSTRERVEHVIGIDDKYVDILAQIVKENDAVIVLTSSWQTDWYRDKDKNDVYANYLDKKLSKCGLKAIDKTGFTGYNRGAGIINWLENHEGYLGWIVIDDEVFSDYKKFGINAHLIKTSWSGSKAGLQEKHVRMARKLLEVN